MVESNHDEERLARIEDMVERLQRENAASRIVTARLVEAVAVVAETTRKLTAASPKRRAG
jgi:hypothetical protein